MGRRGVSIIVPRHAAHLDAAPKGEPLPVLYRRFMDHAAERRATATQKNHARTFELAKALPEHPTPGDVGVWLAALCRAGMAGTTAELHRTNLRTVYAHANNAGWCLGNPAALCPPPARTKPEPRAIEGLLPTGRDRNALWRAFLDAMQDDRERAWLHVMRYAGPRLGEALAIEPQHLFEAGDGRRWLRVEQQRGRAGWETWATKSRAKRRVELHPALREVLPDIMRAPLAKVWVGRGGQTEMVPRFVFPFRANDLERMLAAMRAIDLSAFEEGDAWHAFRHTFAVECTLGAAPLTKPVPIEKMSVMLGHRDLKTTQVYLRSLLGRHAEGGAWD